VEAMAKQYDQVYRRCIDQGTSDVCNADLGSNQWSAGSQVDGLEL
jgi:hypothetical protein